MILKKAGKATLLLTAIIAGLTFLYVSQGIAESSKSAMDKEALLRTDKEFSDLSVKQGIVAAFDSFAADSATLFRNRADPYVGRQAIHDLQSKSGGTGTLQWQPYFADAGTSGDLGYTLGKWQYNETDSTGKLQTLNGYYVTIWKKQPDGKWKYVFDSGVSGPPPLENK